jgi:hypothetical protein
MISLQNIIAPIVNDGDSNIYVIGFCLKNGKIIKTKVYNKFLDFDIKNEQFIKKFGGEHCLKLYQTTTEWKNLYPGFSGFTLGVEFYFDSDKNVKYKYGYGHKDIDKNSLVYNAYYINKDHEIIEKEIYDYAYIKNRFATEFLEVKRSNPECFCYCPKINKYTIPSIEQKIFEIVKKENIDILNSIKNINDNYSIVNYGINPDYEKIYIVNEKKHLSYKIYDLIVSVSDFFENLPLDKPNYLCNTGDQ